MSRQNQLTRRRFIAATSAAAAFTIVPRHILGAGQTPPSEKLNIAGIGLNGMGIGDVKSCTSQNIVALCDVDQNILTRCVKELKDLAAKESRQFTAPKLHVDYRRMLESQKDIDAVIIATPDHLHAVVSAMAMKMGKHVHCQKPLTHSVYEARKIGQIARETKVATQMGNQGQASEESRLICEMIWDGAIGNVLEVHAWSNRNPDISPRGIARPKEMPPVPASLNWDLWLGPAPARPYHPCYCPFSWRGWWDFGTGVLGDIGCHQLSTIFKCLKLGHPSSVEACSTNWQRPAEVQKETAPLASTVRYKFPSQGGKPPVEIIWYDGGMRPPRPDELEPSRRFGVDDGIYYVGDKGKLLGSRLIPESKMKQYTKPQPTLPRSPGHYIEWINTCKGGKPAGANFVDHAAHLAEVVLLGNIAIRTNQKLEWDGENQRFTNSPEANQFINPPYREGWSL